MSVANEWGLTTSYSKYSGIVSPGPMAPYPTGGVMTSASDIGHYFVALLNGGTYQGTQVISPTSIAQMWTPEPASGAEAYGFGWGEMNVQGMRLLSHAGDIGAGGGYGSSGSQFLVAPDGRVLILAWQRGRGRHSGIAMDMEWAMVTTVRDGKIIRIDNYDDRREAREALGLRK